MKEQLSVSGGQNAKIKIELGSVQETLLFALWCRAKESQRERPLLMDPKASEIMRRLDYDFSRMERTVKEYAVLISNVSSKYCDDAINGFIAAHPKATIVNIGAGLDTTFYRIDNGLLRWYDLDLPDVTDLRRRLMPETDRSKCIAKSVFDFGWFDEVGAHDDGLFFFARGVFCYLDATDLRRLFSALPTRFPGAEMVFNSYNAVGRWGGNHLAVRRAGIRDARLKWAIGSAKQLMEWDRRIEVIDEWPMFSRITRDPSWKPTTRFLAKLSDWYRFTSMVHLHFR